MSWSQLEAKREISPHQTSLQELNNLRRLIQRDLADASIGAVSADRRFATAYNAALQTGTMLIACSGYRVAARAGHHAVTFEAALLAMGQRISRLTDYFDLCRRKRNSIDYHAAFVASETEAAELLKNAQEFLLLAEEWIVKQHPSLKA